MSEEHFNVEDQEGYVREYDEDELITIRKGDLRAILDLATGSMDFGSGFWTEEQTEIARRTARLLEIDVMLVTPSNMTCTYTGYHRWQKYQGQIHIEQAKSVVKWHLDESGRTVFDATETHYFIRCRLCGTTEQIASMEDAPRGH